MKRLLPPANQKTKYKIIFLGEEENRTANLKFIGRGFWEIMFYNGGGKIIESRTLEKELQERKIEIIIV